MPIRQHASERDEAESLAPESNSLAPSIALPSAGSNSAQAARAHAARSQAVQRKAAAGGRADPAAIHARARGGVADGGAQLPHLDRIQQAFGHHDVTGISAHSGATTAAACEAIGADAYATGNDVAFRGSPDLRTAAHEAAHVVQQRGGVQLLGGVGKAGDDYERNADDVADAVVRGESAEELLDGVADPAAATSDQSAAVQRVELVDIDQLPHLDPDAVNLPNVADPEVSLNDHDSGECRQVPRSEVVGSPAYADTDLVFVDPQGDPWTLTVEKLVFTTGSGAQFEVPWDDITFGSDIRSKQYEKSGGLYFPLAPDGFARTYDTENTPNIVRAARLVFDVIAELKNQRVEYAELTAIFAGSIAALGSAAYLVNSYHNRPTTNTRTRTRTRTPPPNNQQSRARSVKVTPKQLQKKFKHAGDFGVSGNYNKANAAKFESAINSHINKPGVQPINGTYRGDAVIHYLDPKTGLNVITDPSGNFVSGWQLNAAQLANVQTRGSL